MDLWFKPASAGVSKFLPAGEDPDQDAEEESEEKGAVTFLTIEGKSYVKKLYQTETCQFFWAVFAFEEFFLRTHVIDERW